MNPEVKAVAFVEKKFDSNDFDVFEWDHDGREDSTLDRDFSVQDGGAFAVIVEGGTAEEMVSVDGARLAPVAARSPVGRLWIGVRRATRVSLRIAGRVGQRVKVTLLTVRRAIRRHINCEPCKALARLLIKALLSAVGAPTVFLDDLDDVYDWMARAAEAVLPDAVRELFTRIGDEWLDTILSVLRSVNVQGRLIRGAAELVCRHLGCCP